MSAQNLVASALVAPTQIPGHGPSFAGPGLPPFGAYPPIPTAPNSFGIDTNYTGYSVHSGGSSANTNGRISSRFTVDLRRSAPNDTGQFQFVWASTIANGGSYQSSQKFMSLSRINRTMDKDPWIAKYGDYHTYDAFMRDWSWIGVRQSQDQSPHNTRHDSTLNFWLAKRANQIPNLWTNDARQGDHVYIVLRRVPVKDKLKEYFGEDTVRKRPKKNEHGTVLQRELEKEDEILNLRRKGKGLYTWKLVPVLSKTMMPPPKHLYCNRRDGSVGNYYYIGVIWNIKGQTSDRAMYNVTELKEQTAIKAVYPKDDGDEFLHAMFAGGLSQLEIDMRVNCA